MSESAEGGGAGGAGDADGLARRLHGLALFASAIRAPGFAFGQWHDSERLADGSHSLPWFELSDDARALLAAAGGWLLPSFAWPAWAQTDEAQLLKNDPAAMAGATPEQIAKMLTWLVRSERFVEGGLVGAYESGVFGRLLDRVAVLAGELDDVSERSA